MKQNGYELSDSEIHHGVKNALALIARASIVIFEKQQVGFRKLWRT